MLQLINNVNVFTTKKSLKKYIISTKFYMSNNYAQLLQSIFWVLCRLPEEAIIHSLSPLFLTDTPKTLNVVVILAFRGHLVRQSIYGQSAHAGPCIVDPVRNYVQDNPFYDPPTRHQNPIWSTALNGQGKFLYVQLFIIMTSREALDFEVGFHHKVFSKRQQVYIQRISERINANVGFWKKRENTK